jgi:hypothetical protein
MPSNYFDTHSINNFLTLDSDHEHEHDPSSSSAALLASDTTLHSHSDNTHFTPTTPTASSYSQPPHQTLPAQVYRRPSKRSESHPVENEPMEINRVQTQTKQSLLTPTKPLGPAPTMFRSFRSIICSSCAALLLPIPFSSILTRSIRIGLNLLLLCIPVSVRLRSFRYIHSSPF